jgi:S1-C subfamily serine protease
MKRSALRAVVMGVGLVACSPTRPPEEGKSTPSQDVRSLKDATVTLSPGHCAGVIVADGHHALTAAHCIQGAPGSRQSVLLRDGHLLGGVVKVVDPERDLAVLRLDTRAPVHPLTLASSPPVAGEALLFAGRNDRDIPPQEVELRRLGRCPSLPDVPLALFTSLRGEPGDSGAPVVDDHLRVVGLVHGGAACSIVAPTADFSPLVDMLVAELAQPATGSGIGGTGNASPH